MKAHQLVDFLVRKGFNEFAQWVVENSADNTPTVDVIRSTSFSQRMDMAALVRRIKDTLEKRGHVAFLQVFEERVQSAYAEKDKANDGCNPREFIEAYYVYRDKVAVLIADAIGFLYGDPERIVYEEEDR